MNHRIKGNQPPCRLTSDHKYWCSSVLMLCPHRLEQSSLFIGELEETTGTPLYNVDEDCPSGHEIQ